ncbi:ArsR/SmtB family transcription factor [Neobacillus sp. D3-1R]|uniref:ArsR/SmtB family transcription factor n=1 Tax=Neobacillus sp. D3-1R TaxID=3445778 RepID=UPI003FA09DB3
MSIGQQVANTALLIGDPSRAAILTVLLDGRFHTASELSMLIGVKPQTTSYHLSKLMEQNIIVAEKQGRHRYFGIENQEVAKAMETLLTLSPPAKIKSLRQSREDAAVRYARTCYDHIAGFVGVQIADAFIQKGYLDREFSLTTKGEKFLEKFSVNLKEIKKKRRSFCHKCLDWSERRHHIAGSLGLAILERFIDLGWVARQPKTRALSVTEKGKMGMRDWLSIDI